MCEQREKTFGCQSPGNELIRAIIMSGLNAAQKMLSTISTVDNKPFGSEGLNDGWFTDLLYITRSHASFQHLQIEHCYYVT